MEENKKQTHYEERLKNIKKAQEARKKNISEKKKINMDLLDIIKQEKEEEKDE